ncbi:hypothetical protein Vadar_000548 [Vaccinium darrowii]|uniref:Uncharacterized protein n=1 Tax=Vaccinium darrowii TaxID=229202 RepID=A0ACB7WWY5_9ERIC|nr:hypothetical protein Vadar_000548 [Vaccinium darrowii]
MERANSDQVVVIIDQETTKNQSPDHQPHPKNPIHTTQSLHSTPTRPKTLRRLSFSKPKSRNVEFNHPPVSRIHGPEFEELQPLNESYLTSDDDDSDGYDYDDEEEDLEEDEGGIGKEKLHGRKKKTKKINCRALIEWTLFIIIVTNLFCSLTIESLKNHNTWGLENWKWCLMVMVTFSGRLVSGWVISFFVFVIERNFMLRERVLYFVYGLRKSFQNCVWLALVLLAWTIMFNAKVHKKNKMLKKVFQALVAVLVGATIWLIKIILVKTLASSFHVATYFDRMKESVFHHYILDTLSGPPMDDSVVAQRHNNHLITTSQSLPPKLRKTNMVYSKRFGSKRLDMEKLRKLSTGSASAWNVKRLVNYVRSFGLPTVSTTMDEFGRAESEITSEWGARTAAKRIFKNVAKPGAK